MVRRESEVFEMLAGATIIEHKPDGPVIGRVEYAGYDRGGTSIGIGWYAEGNRTTVFAKQAWSRIIGEGYIVFTRHEKDDQVFDVPPPQVDHYTIIMLPQER